MSVVTRVLAWALIALVSRKKIVSVHIRKMEKRAKKKIRWEIRTVREIVNSMEHSLCMSIKHF